MKNFILSLFLFIGACSDKFKHKPTVSVLTTIAYSFNANNNDHRLSVARKEIKDTLTFTDVDSFTQKRKWVRDSFYYVPVLDSIKGRKDTMAVRWIPLPKKLLLTDFNKSW